MLATKSICEVFNSALNNINAAVKMTVRVLSCQPRSSSQSHATYATLPRAVHEVSIRLPSTQFRVVGFYISKNEETKVKKTSEISRKSVIG